MRNRLGGQSGVTGRVLLLSSSHGLGGGIERYVQTLESAFAATGVACQRPGLCGCGAGAHARRLAQSRAILRAAREPARQGVAHRALRPVAPLLARISPGAPRWDRSCTGTSVQGGMPSLANSPLAPILGQRVPLRGPARMLFRSYARMRYQPGACVERQTTKLGDLFEVDLSSFLEWQLWAFGCYKEHFAELFRCLVSPGDRCVDVGANVGVHTVRLAKLVGARGEVIALEPDEELAHRAHGNIMLNRLSSVHDINAAASNEAGDEVQLYRPGSRDTNRARASLLRHSHLTGSVTTVPVVTIDDVCPGPVALIKIDVEGHEAAVVRGASATIDRYSTAVIFEYAPQLFRDASQSPFGWLADRGYELLRIRRIRNGVTGRGRLALDRLPELPANGGDILAVPVPRAERLSALVH